MKKYNLLNIISNILSEKQNIICLFVVIAFCVFSQLILGHYQIFHSVLVSSLWKNPSAFFNFYIPRFVLACTLCSFVFFVRNKWLSVIPVIFVDICLWLLVPSHDFGMLDVVRELLLCCTIVACLIFQNPTYFKLSKDIKSWIVNGSFLISILAQCLIYHYYAFSDYVPPTIMDGIMVHISKLGISVLIASFIFLFRSSWWTIIASICIDVWIFAEQIYFRANGFFLDGLSFTMIGNMNGWWDTVPMYIYWTDWLVLLPTVFHAVIIVIVRKSMIQRSLSNFIVCLSAGVFLTFISILGFQFSKLGKANIQMNPFADDVRVTIVMPGDSDYIRKFSIIHAFVYDVVDFVRITIFENDENLLTQSENLKINECINHSLLGNLTYETPLIICLVESLENWAIRPEITPNICDFMEQHKDHMLYAERVISQVKNAHSADGQLIVNTGLLPVEKGTVCFRYHTNIFPSLSEIYGERTAALFPHDLNVWNQKQMSDAYHINSNYVTSTSDKEIFSSAISLLNKNDYVLAVTSSTHTPFVYWADSAQIELPESMPLHMANYLKCMWCLDNGIEVLLKSVNDNDKLRNSTIVITGDHTIFNCDQRKQFVAYAERDNLNYRVSENFSSCIIYSPRIKQYTHIIDSVYQMDVYPTILSTIGCDEYYWKGVGVNLRDTIARHNRKISVIEAHDLSDKLIRSNFFKEYLEQN